MSLFHCEISGFTLFHSYLLHQIPDRIQEKANPILNLLLHLHQPIISIHVCTSQSKHSTYLPPNQITPRVCQPIKSHHVCTSQSCHSTVGQCYLHFPRDNLTFWRQKKMYTFFNQAFHQISWINSELNAPEKPKKQIQESDR